MTKIDPDLRERLESIYEEVMWLARRPHVSAGCARAWYTHIMAEGVKRRLRLFTGKVSRTAVDTPDAVLRLEHYLRIQTALTQFVERHKALAKPKPAEFLKLLIAYEQVHIVTFSENYAAMTAGGDYKLAGIKLVAWRSIPRERRSELWKQMLRGKVANANDFAV